MPLDCVEMGVSAVGSALNSGVKQLKVLQIGCLSTLDGKYLVHAEMLTTRDLVTVSGRSGSG